VERSTKDAWRGLLGARGSEAAPTRCSGLNRPGRRDAEASPSAVARLARPERSRRPRPSRRARAAVAVEQHVLRLEVAVDDAELVQMLRRGGGSARDERGLGRVGLSWRHRCLRWSERAGRLLGSSEERAGRPGDRGGLPRAGGGGEAAVAPPSRHILTGGAMPAGLGRLRSHRSAPAVVVVRSKK